MGRSQGVFSLRVAVSTKRTPGVVLAAHVSPDTCAAAGCIATLNAAYGMAIFFVAEEAATFYYGPWNPLPPGRMAPSQEGGGVEDMGPSPS